LYGPQGWVAPCTQLSYGFEKQYKSLVEKTAWENFGRGDESAVRTMLESRGV